MQPRREAHDSQAGHRRKVTHHHASAIRCRLALRGQSVRALARQAGVAASTLYAVLDGEQVSSRHLSRILEAVGIEPDASSEQLRLEKRVFDVVVSLIVGNDIDRLREAVVTLEASGAPAAPSRTTSCRGSRKRPRSIGNPESRLTK